MDDEGGQARKRHSFGLGSNMFNLLLHPCPQLLSNFWTLTILTSCAYSSPRDKILKNQQSVSTSIYTAESGMLKKRDTFPLSVAPSAEVPAQS